MARRQSRYLIQMSIRVVCFLVAVFTWGHIPMWASLILLVAAVVLPYAAVLFANAGRERNDDGAAYLGPREIGGGGDVGGLGPAPTTGPRFGAGRVSLLGPTPDAVDELVCSARRGTWHGPDYHQVVSSNRRRHDAPEGEVHRITTAPEPLAADMSRRQSRYLIQMSVRVVAFLLAVFTWNHIPHWASLILIVLAVVLPYMAVLFANAGRERNDGDADYLGTPRDRRGARRPRRSPDPVGVRSRTSEPARTRPGRGRRADLQRRGCRATATWGLLWNNPKLHTPGLLWNNPKLHTPNAARSGSRATTTASPCRSSSASRDFLRDVVPASTLEQVDAP